MMTRAMLAFTVALFAAIAGCNTDDCSEGYTKGALGTCVVDESQIPCRCAEAASFICCRKHAFRGHTNGCVGDPVCDGDVLVCPEGSFVHAFECSGWPPLP